MSYFYTLEDWSINPCKKKGLDLRDVINECSALEDEEIQLVANLMIDETYNGNEFSITCTGKSA